MAPRSSQAPFLLLHCVSLRPSSSSGSRNFPTGSKSPFLQANEGSQEAHQRQKRIEDNPLYSSRSSTHQDMSSNPEPSHDDLSPTDATNASARRELPSDSPNGRLQPKKSFWRDVVVSSKLAKAPSPTGQPQGFRRKNSYVKNWWKQRRAGDQSQQIVPRSNSAEEMGIAEVPRWASQ